VADDALDLHIRLCLETGLELPQVVQRWDDEGNLLDDLSVITGDTALHQHELVVLAFLVSGKEGHAALFQVLVRDCEA